MTFLRHLLALIRNRWDEHFSSAWARAEAERMNKAIKARRELEQRMAELVGRGR